ncbi:hypothetical protein GCM10028801_15830 [Nocardioides maradonensis]
MSSTPVRVILGLSLAGVLTAALAACGSGNSSPGGQTAPPPATTPASTATGSGAPDTSPAPTTSNPAPATHPTEFNPPGDIPDNAVFVDHVVAGTRVHFSVPEGWAQSTHGGVASFTDHFNSIAIQVLSAAQAPTPASARSTDVPQLRGSQPQFQLTDVDTVTRKGAGTAVRIRYLIDSKPDPVTDKVVRDAVERYEFWRRGQEAVLTLTGPQNADNVDPWQIVSDSVAWK